MANVVSRHEHPGLGTVSGTFPAARGAVGAVVTVGTIIAFVLFSSTGALALAAAPPADAAPAAEVARSPRTPRVHEHGLGTGYHAVMFGTESSDHYTVHGPALVYDYFIGRRWGFMLRASAFLPLYGTMSGPSGDFSGSLGGAYDERRYGVDGLFMAARRVPLSPRFVFTGGFGVHIQAFSLTGTTYSPVEIATLGVGGLGKLDVLLSHWLSLDLQLATGLDPIDLIDHRNPAQWVIPLSLSFSLAARY